MMRASCLQLRIDLCQREENTLRALKMAELAVDGGAEILAFPELFISGFCYEQMPEDPPYPSLDLFRRFAIEHDCLIIGSIWSGRHNMGFCLDGEELQMRPKIHPFGPEKEHFKGGTFISPVSTKWGKVGLEICYDLRFPEVARSLALQGADFLATIAQFPAARGLHWRTLCLARAMENQIPHLACNWAQGGNSMIVDAYGDLQAEAKSDEEEVICGEIDLVRRDSVRKEIPCFFDRRPEVY